MNEYLKDDAVYASDLSECSTSLAHSSYPPGYCLALVKPIWCTASMAALLLTPAKQWKTIFISFFCGCLMLNSSSNSSGSIVKASGTFLNGMFVAQAILPVCTNSCGSRTSNSCIFPAVSIAFSSVKLISVHWSNGAVAVLLFEQWLLNASFLISDGQIKDLVVHMFFTDRRKLWLLTDPTNRARTIMMKTVKFQSPVILLRRH